MGDLRIYTPLEPPSLKNPMIRCAFDGRMRGGERLGLGILGGYYRSLKTY